MLASMHMQGLAQNFTTLYFCAAWLWLLTGFLPSQTHLVNGELCLGGAGRRRIFFLSFVE